MSEQVGIDQYLYRNTATYGSPTWNLVDNVRDLDLEDDMGEADVSRRAVKIKQMEPTQRTLAVNFQMVYDPDDADFTAIQSAYTGRTILDIAIADGLIATVGTIYFRCEYKVFKFKRGEPLDGAVIYDVTIKPCFSANAPTLTTVAS